MTTERDLIQRLARKLDRYRQVLRDDRTLTDELADEARAALSQPEPEGPTLEEINELFWKHSSEIGDIGVGLAHEDTPALIREALTRWGRPAIEPVPVAERPWEREGWCDAEGRCALFSQSLIPDCPTWIIAPAAWGARFPDSYIYSLPHYALPIPAPTETP